MRPILYSGIRMNIDWSFQSYPWNEEASCWIDASLEALFFCRLQLGKTRFTHAIEDYQTISPNLFKLSEQFSLRLEYYQTRETLPELQTALYCLRNDIAKQLSLDTMKQNNPMVLSFNIKIFVNN